MTLRHLNTDEFDLIEVHGSNAMQTNVIARSKDSGYAMAAAQLSWGRADMLAPDPVALAGGYVPEDEPDPDNVAQGKFVGRGFNDVRPRVSVAANTAGAPPGIVHTMLAAASHRHNVVPYADFGLTQEGSTMSRSAARRGLVIGHPRNPDMMPTESREYQRSLKVTPAQVARVLMEGVAGGQARDISGGEMPHTYSDDELHNARIRVARVRPTPQPVYIQRTLPGIRVPRVAREEE